MDADLRAAVGLIAGAALIRAHAVGLAVEHGLDGVVHAAQVGGLDLRHVAGLRVGEQLDVLEGIAPFVGDQLHVDAAAIQLGGQPGEGFDLGLAGGVAVHGAFDAQMEGLGDLAQLGDVIGHGGIVVVSVERADGAVAVDVQHGVVALVGAMLEDAVAQPLDIGGELFAVQAQLGFHVVDQRVGKHLRALDDHLVGVVVAVVAGLGEDRDGRFGHGAAVFVGHDLAHEAAGGLGHRVQQRLGNAVADGGVQALAVDLDALHHGGELAEVVGFAADQRGLDVLLDQRDEVLGEEEGIASARAGILHGRAVAPGDLAVLEDEHDGDGLAGLAHGAEALGHGLAGIEGAVVARALLDGALIVKVKTGSALGAYDVQNLHDDFLL